MYFVVTLALKILIYASVNCGFSGFAAPRLSEGKGCLQTMPSVSGEKELKPKTTSFYSTSVKMGMAFGSSPSFLLCKIRCSLNLFLWWGILLYICVRFFCKNI